MELKKIRIRCLWIFFKILFLSFISDEPCSLGSFLSDYLILFVMVSNDLEFALFDHITSFSSWQLVWLQSIQLNDVSFIAVVGDEIWDIQFGSYSSSYKNCQTRGSLCLLGFGQFWGNWNNFMLICDWHLTAHQFSIIVLFNFKIFRSEYFIL